MTYAQAMDEFDPVFGIEVHVELNTRTKMFCGCANEFGAEPNTQVCPVCLGLPGAMPVTNEKAVESAIRLGLALGCSIRESSRFARKNYFYPDLAKDYQISQYDEPTCYEGALDVVLDDGTVVEIGIERAHMEEDAGKNTHVGGTGGIQGADYSLVDYNRGGVPLVEIVTKPITGMGDRTAEVARAYVATIRDIVRALGISDGRMEQGSVRADVNLSLRPKAVAGESQDDVPFGKRSETKNVNSLRAIERAVHFEAARQASLLLAGRPVVQETRHWHEDTSSTTPGRSKEEAEDYRYFPEPDLLPVQPAREWVEELRGTIPEHPAKMRARLREEWGFSDLEMRDAVAADALGLIASTVEAGTTAQSARKWWMGELSRVANDREVALGELPVTPAAVAELQGLVDSGKINDKLARQALEGVLAGEGSPTEVVASRGLEVVSDDSALEKAVDDALAAQPDVLAKIQDGKVQAAGAIVGAVMKATRGQADAARVREIILQRAGVEG
ncbi:Asp-tRNA(Asn)/Glu-tRNA(Gln) amidotransferase subunit GatB [Demequina lignilytica]|uniref:Aspartyl/glutamyl-tRNA(Asn/Gln) amidotransferase subunit B n=1 Tax=Demequina lignilytica TaxID=3051663 RepID=A0AAW7M2Q1_9MICO|nr:MULTISPECIES: Asp-tRNA(Asn)/Glu-tRNA(Gln) amidotransferase subunit GatB [unclassified Demequina]MDN4478831.1 Asp-tRNA(Asn)/Glu-tRNA(Gln) amidotransferase subunit GatB [Demequina sp. SYSU T00039-1]MDN4484070.1 Asp-tRNA(Asn)/Glu-tRNA(Gln) amidotransferase subunit GatB [Demequina sp. SYSU T0a273]MDN4488929.1 Asp-tRNA(Asn)/Glu-tRNA(Gln) amidotransferase subunit GatB [Demequina sp. SYSU T00039]MDN4490347.1 Asp-tRNA(Asn)/Glu-tRNA(Gln) amidotransferase subunit GatB [Demequina sp. SYSU T00068]